MRSIEIIQYAEARKIIDSILAEVEKTVDTAVVAVVDTHGELIAFARMDGAPVSSIRIAVNKAYTAARERKTTEDIGRSERAMRDRRDPTWQPSRAKTGHIKAGRPKAHGGVQDNAPKGRDAALIGPARR